MGAKPASGELNKALIPLFQDIKGVHIIHDDLIIATPDSSIHNKALEEVFQIIKASGMTLNREKCMFNTHEIPFWGYIVSAEGVRPDPKKIAALQAATKPKDKHEVMSFLCMIQSNAEFISKLSEKRETFGN